MREKQVENVCMCAIQQITTRLYTKYLGRSHARTGIEWNESLFTSIRITGTIEKKNKS